MTKAGELKVRNRVCVRYENDGPSCPKCSSSDYGEYGKVCIETVSWNRTQKGGNL